MKMTIHFTTSLSKQWFFMYHNLVSIFNKVGSLNEKLERKDKELTSCKRVAEETIEELQSKVCT